MFRLVLPKEMTEGFRTVVRLNLTGDILQNRFQPFHLVSDFSLEVTKFPFNDETPPIIYEALSKISLYHMQEKAQQALEDGDVRGAQRTLGHLTTRLNALGKTELADQVQDEIHTLTRTQALSSEGRKQIKYGTRKLLLPSGPEKDTDT
jgi:hypothetical protein